jgi:hypothetical protein
MPSGPVQGHDLARDCGHELEVVRPQRAGDPPSRHGPMRPLLAGGLDGDPVGVRIVDVLVARVRVGARQHHHVQFAAARHQVAEGIGVLHPLAAIVQRDFGGVIGHAAAGAQTGGVGMGALEIVQPELQVVLAGIVFGQGQLRPAHGPLDTRERFRRAGAAKARHWRSRSPNRPGRGAQEIPAGERSIGHMAGCYHAPGIRTGDFIRRGPRASQPP